MALYLVTGGAGYIGSNLVESLLERGERVRVLDNFSTGKEENLDFVGRGAVVPDQFILIRGDLRDLSACREACREVDFVLHQGALGSVPRSVEDPLATHEVNVTGTLNMLRAAREMGVRRFVNASSSSVYGDVPGSSKAGEPTSKVETMVPQPRSPYAASKLAGEVYGRVFYLVYGLETVSLRYFNVFGRRQDPDSQYAAVIPRFIKSLLVNKPPTIYGDGEQSRDFTYVEDVIQAILLACRAPGEALGEAINVAYGACTTVNSLVRKVAAVLGTSIRPVHEKPRSGDVRHSLANVDKARKLLGYEPRFDLDAGLVETVKWYQGQPVPS
jgi:nucleoside-diphosphate-sugar epimerase